MFSWSNVPHPIIALSPMADMTDSAFCRVVREVGAPNVPMFREMVSAEAVVRGNEKTLDMTDIHPAERPLVQQIFGGDPNIVSEAARIIEDQHHPEAFDINMGCPVYKIVHNFNGAALMKDPTLAASIIRATKKAITVPLSVKIRLGWSDPRECLEFIKVVEDAGADLVTIHGRTKEQGYSGVADWKMVGEAKKHVRIPVLCNGDVHKAELINPALEISGCDGVLIARGALGNPWIFRDYEIIRKGSTPTPVTLEERVNVVRRHLDLHCEQYGEHAINTFRKHLSWYFKGISNMKTFKEPMMTAKTRDELEAVFTQLLAAE